MEETLSVSYVKCPFCTAKNHCAACGGELSEALAAREGVDSAAVDLLAHTARVTSSMAKPWRPSRGWSLPRCGCRRGLSIWFTGWIGTPWRMCWMGWDC